jgi:arginine exporter protein ArgO
MAVSTRATEARTGLQKATLATGIVFLLLGMLGFIPGVTANFDSLGLAGPGSKAELFGVFRVSVLHNAVHLATAIAGLVMARTHRQGRNFLIYGGVAYLFLWLYGLLMGDDLPANFLPENNADNWLHLALGLAMIALAVLLSPKTLPGDKSFPGSQGMDRPARNPDEHNQS